MSVPSREAQKAETISLAALESLNTLGPAINSQVKIQRHKMTLARNFMITPSIYSLPHLKSEDIPLVIITSI